MIPLIGLERDTELYELNLLEGITLGPIVSRIFTALLESESLGKPDIESFRASYLEEIQPLIQRLPYHYEFPPLELLNEHTYNAYCEEWWKILKGHFLDNAKKRGDKAVDYAIKRCGDFGAPNMAITFGKNHILDMQSKAVEQNASYITIDPLNIKNNPSQL